MHLDIRQSPGSSIEEIAGVGVSSTLDAALKLCRWRAEQRQPAWNRLGYLQLGVYSHEQVPPGLPEILDEAGLPSVVHLLEINLIQPLSQQRDKLIPLLQRVQSIQPRYVEEDLGLWCWGQTELEQHMLPPIFDDETATEIAKNVIDLQSMLDVPFHVENPPIYFELGTLDLLTFMQRVAERAGCGLILDIGHLVGYCVATDRAPDEYLEAWTGFEHVRELHVAGYNLLPDSASAPMWYDNHADPIPEFALHLIEIACRGAGRSLPITLEQEGASFGRIATHVDRVWERFAS